MDIERHIDVLIRARYAILYIVSYEEDRVAAVLNAIATRWKKQFYTWSLIRGMLPFGKTGTDTNTRDPGKALEFIEGCQTPAVFFLRDFDAFFTDHRITRHLRELAHLLKVSHKTVVITSPCLQLPVQLEKDITVVDFQLPSFEDIGVLLDQMVAEVSQNPNVRIQLDANEREQLIKAALGLTLTEAENAFAKGLVMDASLSARDVEIVMAEKQQIIRKSGLLEFFEAQDQWADIGGLELLKEWLGKRRLAFNENARAFGLPPPKGILLLGVQGCGKSLTAKAVAGLWRLPLLRLDVGSVFSGIVGSSEENMRRAIRTAESVAPCILWLDELEKGLSGVQSSAVSDAGTASRVFGSFITWLQEKTAPVFVIATANNIQLLPPETMRKGRFDEIFFVDLPTAPEREAIFKIHLYKRKRDPARFELTPLVNASEGFSGAEIEQAVISALYDAFEAEREVTTEDVLHALRTTVPLSRTMSDQIDALREWASVRARPATQIATVSEGTPRRLEFDAR